MKELYLSVVIPSYDEMANLQKGVLDKVKSFLDKSNFQYEVIVVDDGSRDGSIDFLKNFIKDNKEFSLIENPHLGKAGAVTTGVLKSIGKYVLFTDMDQATPIEEINKLLPLFTKNYDIAIGSRNRTRKGSPISRQIISQGFILLRTMIVGMHGISDTQCGFKAFEHKTAIKLFTKISELHNGYKKISGSAVTAGFDIELLFIAQKMGFKIKEVPVRWLYVETRRVSPIKDSIEGIVDLIKIKRNDINGKYAFTT